MDDDREKAAMGMQAASSSSPEEEASQIPEIPAIRETQWQYLRRYFTTKEGWVGNYVNAEPLSPSLCVCVRVYASGS